MSLTNYKDDRSHSKGKSKEKAQVKRKKDSAATKITITS